MTNDFNPDPDPDPEKPKPDDERRITKSPDHPFEGRMLTSTLSLTPRELERMGVDEKTVQTRVMKLVRDLEKTYPCVAYVMERDGAFGINVDLSIRVLLPRHVDRDRIREGVEREIEEFRYNLYNEYSNGGYDD